MSAKLVLVTGAGRGIGRSIALKLVQEGFAVSGASRSAPELAETKQLSGAAIRTAQVDVRDEGAVERWIENEATQAGAPLWGLVTAAGIMGDISPFIESDWEEWKAGVEANLYGTALASKFFARHLVKHKMPGRIVMLSGGGATQPLENLSSYCASKSAVVRFGETLAVELAGHGITVNSIAPGSINTAITEKVLAAGPAKAGKAFYEKMIQQKNCGGTPPDKAAALTAFLLSEKSASISGRLLSALWDDWANLPMNEAALADKDLYTLRRKVPPEGAAR